MDTEILKSMNYYKPQKLSEITKITSKEKAKIYFLAGATDLYVQLKEQSLQEPNIFIDISELKEIKEISENKTEIHIGAGITFTEITESKIIGKNAPLLIAAAKEVGSPLIRNRATIGGNIANSSPAGDSIPPLYVMDAKLLLNYKNTDRLVDIKNFFTGPKKNILTNGEIIVKIIIPKKKYNFFTFKKLGPRKALAISKVSLAIVGNIFNGKINQIKISAGAVAPTVIRCTKTESYLKGKIIDEETIKTACALIETEVTPIDDFRSTAQYRQKMSAILLKKSLQQNLI